MRDANTRTVLPALLYSRASLHNNSGALPSISPETHSSTPHLVPVPCEQQGRLLRQLHVTSSKQRLDCHAVGVPVDAHGGCVNNRTGSKKRKHTVITAVGWWVPVGGV